MCSIFLFLRMEGNKIVANFCNTNNLHCIGRMFQLTSPFQNIGFKRLNNESYLNVEIHNPSQKNIKKTHLFNFNKFTSLQDANKLKLK